MITLGTRAASFSDDFPATGRGIVRLSTDVDRPMALRRREAFIVGDGPIAEGFYCYVVIGQLDQARWNSEYGPTIHLPVEFAYLADGDIMRISPVEHSIRVLFRMAASVNSFLLTERCNNYCLMCSQPPRNVQDGWIVDEILETLPLIDPGVPEIMFSGGEPTLLGDRFLELVRASKSYLPWTALHVLSNGRSFSDPEFARSLGEIGHPDLMIGIPIYADLPHIHDYVVQADGAHPQEHAQHS